MQTDYTAKVKIILVYHGNKYHSQLRFSTFDRFIPRDINLFPSRLVARKNEGKGTFIDKCKRERGKYLEFEQETDPNIAHGVGT